MKPAFCFLKRANLIHPWQNIRSSYFHFTLPFLLTLSGTHQKCILHQNGETLKLLLPGRSFQTSICKRVSRAASPRQQWKILHCDSLSIAFFEGFPKKRNQLWPTGEVTDLQKENLLKCNTVEKVFYIAFANLWTLSVLITITKMLSFKNSIFLK